MSPKLDELIQLYGKLHESPANERDVHFERLRAACEREGQVAGIAWRAVFGFAKHKFFEQLRSDDKRQGRLHK